MLARIDSPTFGTATLQKHSVFCAVVFPLTFLAMAACPDAVELGHDLSEKFFVCSYDASFKVSPATALGSHSSSGEIGAAGIGK